MSGSRRNSREYAMQLIYLLQFNEVTNLAELFDNYFSDKKCKDFTRSFAEDIVRGCYERLEELDRMVSSVSKHWDIDRITGVDKAILRISLYQMLYMDVPKNVVIDEAVEIAKKYGDEKSYIYINGILAKILEKKVRE